MDARPQASANLPRKEPETGPATPLSPLERLRSTLPRARLRSARELAGEGARAPAPPPLATGVAALDRLLGGGLPRGEMVELVGSRSSGRLSAVLEALAAATSAGEAAALIDLDDGFDPQEAAAAGVLLDRLLWVRPPRLKQALIGTEMLLDGGFPLVVLDLGGPPLPGGRGVESSWRRLARAAQRRRAALLVSSPYRVGGTAAAAVLRAGRGRPLWRGAAPCPPLLAGIASRLTLEKLRGRHPGESAALRLAVPP